MISVHDGATEALYDQAELLPLCSVNKIVSKRKIVKQDTLPRSKRSMGKPSNP